LWWGLEGEIADKRRDGKKSKWRENVKHKMSNCYVENTRGVNRE
jgi:hypothetical protein